MPSKAFLFTSLDFYDLPVPSRMHISAVSIAPRSVFDRAVEAEGIVSVKVKHSTGSSRPSAVAVIVLVTLDPLAEKLTVPSLRDKSAEAALSRAITAKARISHEMV